MGTASKSDSGSTTTARSLTDIEPRTWKYVARRAWREFIDDDCADLAAGLTYYAVLSIFPAALALTALLGLVGEADTSVNKVLQVLQPLVSEQTLGTVRPVLEDLANSQSAGWALVLGLVAALWTASGYVGAFARAMNRVYEIQEGRPFWKLRPLMMLVTFVAVLLIALVLLMLVISGPLAESLGSTIGLSTQAVQVWRIAKWPVIAVVALVVIALLYYATPNVKQPRLQWLSIGAGVAIAFSMLASVAFSVYVANFGAYNKTYGSLAGVVITLVFIWLTNVALLLGAEINSELERGRELQSGVAAEDQLQLAPRDTSKIEKAEEKDAEEQAEGRAIRRGSSR